MNFVQIVKSKPAGINPSSSKNRQCFGSRNIISVLLSFFCNGMTINLLDLGIANVII